MFPRLSLAALSIALFAASAAAQVTAFVDGRIIDGRGAVIEHGTVLVQDGVRLNTTLTTPGANHALVLTDPNSLEALEVSDGRGSGKFGFA